MIKNNDFNLIQTQNLLDLELNELKPIFYPKLQLNLIEINNDRQSIDQPISSKLIKVNDKKTKQSIDYKILLDDRCIVGKKRKIRKNLLKLILTFVFLFN